jgi:hypothetical protein
MSVNSQDSEGSFDPHKPAPKWIEHVEKTYVHHEPCGSAREFEEADIPRTLYEVGVGSVYCECLRPAGHEGLHGMAFSVDTGPYRYVFLWDDVMPKNWPVFPKH